MLEKVALCLKNEPALTPRNIRRCVLMFTYAKTSPALWPVSRSDHKNSQGVVSVKMDKQQNTPSQSPTQEMPINARVSNWADNTPHRASYGLPLQ